MGQRFIQTKTKSQVFDIKKDNNEFDGKTKAKLGSAKNPAVITVKTWEKRDELKKIFEDNSWRFRIKVRPNEEEDLTDLDTLQSIGITKVNKENIGRNDPCSCGSGKKYKKCCLIK